MNDLGYKGLRERAAWIDLTGRGKILVHGEDRARLLHAMTTNQVQQLMPGSGCYAFFLTAQGRILADVNLFCLPEYFLLDTEPETGLRLFEHLDKFIIADDVTLEDATEAMATISIEGPEAEEILSGLGAPVPGSEYAIEPWGTAFVARASSTGAGGLTVFLPLDEKTGLVSQLEAADVPEADFEAAMAVRLENHRPRYGPDIDESLIPQETQQMHAINFSKGCYIGQEIVERVRSRGHLNKMLAPIEIDTQEAIAAGTRVFMDGKDVGRITSAAFSPALQKSCAFAVLRVDALGGQALSVNGAPAIAASSPAPVSKC